MIEEQPTKKILKNGIVEYRLADGRLHRNDGPVVIGSDGSKAWYQHGNLHCNDGPAEINSDGTKVWFQHDKRHRIDGPAEINSDGTTEYWLNGVHLKEGSLHLKLVQEKERRLLMVKEATNG